MTKNAFHTLPLHVGDLVKNTAHLSHDQFGVFIRLMLVHFNLGANGIPNNRIAQFARVTPRVWERKYRNSIEPLFVKEGGNFLLPFLIKTLHDIAARSTAQRNKVLKRWEMGDTDVIPAKTSKPVTKIEKLETYLYEQFPSVTTAEEFAKALPSRWQVIATSYGVEQEFIIAVACGFWERFVGRYPCDPLLQEKFLTKKSWEKAWEYECDRLSRVKQRLPPRTDLPMHKKYL